MIDKITQIKSAVFEQWQPEAKINIKVIRGFVGEWQSVEKIYLSTFGLLPHCFVYFTRYIWLWTCISMLKFVKKHFNVVWCLSFSILSFLQFKEIALENFLLDKVGKFIYFFYISGKIPSSGLTNLGIRM